MVRGRNQAEAEQRFINLLSHEKIPNDLKDYDLATKIAFFEVIVWSLSDSLVFPIHLQLSKSYCLIHLASCLKLSRDTKMYGELRKINLEGTLDLVKQLSFFLKKVVFISTVYTLTEQQEIIENQDILGDRTYRNPYERVKAETEVDLKDYCRSINLEIQII